MVAILVESHPVPTESMAFHQRARIMGEFKPWRRIIGVLIWLVALFVICEWVRSYSSFDSIHVWPNEFFSLDGYIWWVSWKPQPDNRRVSKTVELISSEYGKELLRLKAMPSGERLVARVSHAMIAIPLATLSVYLLRWRAKKPVNSQIPSSQ